MKNVKKLGVALCLAATVSLVPVFAQTSNTYSATKYTVRADADKFMDVNRFNEVNFNKFYATTDLDANDFQLGFATKSGKIYIGAYYTGDLWGQLTSEITKEDAKLLEDNASSQIKMDTSTSSKKSVYGPEYDNNNSISLLLGFNNMGIKLNSDFNIGSSSVTTTGKGNTDGSGTVLGVTISGSGSEKSTSKTLNNSYSFGVEWGHTAVALKKVTLKPYASFNFNIEQARTVVNSIETEKEVNNGKTDTDIVTTKKGISWIGNGIWPNYNTEWPEGNTSVRDDYLAMTLSAGTYIEMGKGNPFNSELNIWYTMNPRFYKDGEIAHLTTTTKDNVAGTTDVVENVTIRDGKRYFYNKIGTNYRFFYTPFEKLTFSGYLGAVVDITSRKPGVSATYKLHTIDGNPQVDSQVVPTLEKGKKSYLATEIDSDLGLGLSYSVKPSFKLNFGYFGRIPSVTITSKKTVDETTTENNGVVVESISNKNSTTNVKTGSWFHTLSAGFEWDFAKYCKLDSCINLNNTPSIDGLLSAGWSLGFSFKM